MARKGYPAEFRRRVIDLVDGGKKVAEVSRDLGISEQSIYIWRRQARIDVGLEAGMKSAERAELVAASPRLSWSLPLVSVTARCSQGSAPGASLTSRSRS